MALKLKKGDRVEFISGRGLKYGVVFKGGAKNIKVILDGGRVQVRGDVSAFDKSDHPLPKDSDNVMDRWAVVGYKELADPWGDGPAFSAAITLNGKKVIVVNNNGTGGPNMYHAKSKHLVDMLKKDAEKWHKLFSKHEAVEPEDLWVEWFVLNRPYGVLAKEYLK